MEYEVQMHVIQNIPLERLINACLRRGESRGDSTLTSDGTLGYLVRSEREKERGEVRVTHLYAQTIKNTTQN